MKHKYEGLALDHELPDDKYSSEVFRQLLSCPNLTAVFRRLIKGDKFRFLFIKDLSSGTLDLSPFDRDNPLLAKISSITCQTNGVEIKMDTIGDDTPPGIRHGQYTLLFNDNLICDNLPDEMFEE